MKAITARNNKSGTIPPDCPHSDTRNPAISNTNATASHSAIQRTDHRPRFRRPDLPTPAPRSNARTTRRTDLKFGGTRVCRGLRNL